MDKTMKIYLLIYFVALLVFAGNINHVHQSAVFSDVHIPLAESLLNGDGYRADSLDNCPAFYPLWGYPILLLFGKAIGAPVAFIYILQFLLTILTVKIFYKLFNIAPRWWHSLAFLPFFALMSVKWPDAIVANLLLLYLHYLIKYMKNNKLINIIFAGVFFGILANFRSEYLLLPVFQLFLYPFLTKKERIKQFLKAVSIVIIIGIIFLMPWAIRSYAITGKPKFTASNGGGVAYISLGQLPGNKWGIKPIDQTAFDFVQGKGVNYPYSIEGNSLLNQEFINLVAKYPGEYAKKIAYNIFKTFIGGVYTGEFANLFINQEDRLRINLYISSHSGYISQIRATLDYPASISIPILAEKFLQLCFMIINFTLLLIFIYLIFTQKRSKSPYLAVLAGTVIYKIAIIGLIQYEYRHMNAIYLILLGLTIDYLRNNIKSHKS